MIVRKLGNFNTNFGHYSSLLNIDHYTLMADLKQKLVPKSLCGLENNANQPTKLQGLQKYLTRSDYTHCAANDAKAKEITWSGTSSEIF